MKENLLKLINSIRTKVKYLDRDLSKLEKTLEEVKMKNSKEDGDLK